MNKILFSTKSLNKEEGVHEPFELEYFVIENQTNGRGINISTYGIEIVKTVRSDNIKYTEAKIVHELGTSEATVLNIAKILSENLVTPVSFEYVVEDMRIMAIK